MKKKTIRRSLSLLCAFALLFSLSISAAAAGNEKARGTTAGSKAVLSYDEILNAYPENSRERYVAALAIQNGVSYEEADAMEQQENGKITRALDEVIQYKTVEKVAYTIQDGLGYTCNVYMSVQLKYLYSNVTRKPVSIEGIAGGFVSIPGRSSVDIRTGEFVYENTSTTAKATVLGAATYTDPGVSVSVGIDIISVGTTVGAAIVTTRTLTMVGRFSLADC